MVIVGFVILELVLRIVTTAPYDRLHDPLVSFYNLRPLFEMNDQTGRYETADSRLYYFWPQSFPAAKSQNTFRIFCLGGSTVQGRPYAVPTSFTTWLQRSLQSIEPDTHWQMVNCGGISYASYRLIPILKEVLNHHPDLIILYTGHNEFLEDRNYQSIKNIPYSLIRMHHFFLQFRLYSLPHYWLRDYQNRTAKLHFLPSDINARLDREEGMAEYHRDPVWKEGTIKHFRLNLELMIDACKKRDIPIILMNPVANLRDSPPFKAEHSSGLSEEEISRVNQLLQQINKLPLDDPKRLALCEKAVELDPQNPDVLYQLAQTYDYAGDKEGAKRRYIQAKDQDICPLRILEPMNDAIIETARSYDIALADVKKKFESISKDGIPGDDWLVDHVHPSVDGHKVIADMLAETLRDMNFIKLPPNWKPIRKQAWQDHIEALPNEYFEEGEKELRQLLYWGRRIDLPKQNKPVKRIPAQ